MLNTRLASWFFKKIGVNWPLSLWFALAKIDTCQGSCYASSNYWRHDWQAKLLTWNFWRPDTWLKEFTSNNHYLYSDSQKRMRFLAKPIANVYDNRLIETCPTEKMSKLYYFEQWDWYHPKPKPMRNIKANSSKCWRN